MVTLWYTKILTEHPPCADVFAYLNFKFDVSLPKSIAMDGRDLSEQPATPVEISFHTSSGRGICLGLCDDLEIPRMAKTLQNKSTLHPGRLTWNQKITQLKRKIIFQTSMIMFHVNLPRCTWFVWKGSYVHFFLIENPKKNPPLSMAELTEGTKWW